jgi:hypothetical protein
VNLRYLVPALGFVALSTTSAFAEDKAPAVTFGGWVDAVLAFSDDDTTATSTPGQKDAEAGTIRFTGAASIKSMVKIADKLDAKINLWFDPGTDGDTNNLNMREAYWNWGFADGFSWQMGKYIDHCGLISAEPTGSTFLFINASLIGYTQTYGNDVLGTALNIAPKDSPFSGSVHITNGYYTAGDAVSTGYVSTTDGNRENTDLGFGLDLNYNLPDGMGAINAELAYDMHSGQAAYDTFYTGAAPAIASLGGDVLMLGLNAFLKPTKILTVGAEVMYLTLGDSDDTAGATLDGVDRLQFLLMGNVAFEGAPVPMSATGMIQYVQQEYNFANAETEGRMSVTAALLTNPLGSSNFGLNFEVGYFAKESVDGIKDNGTNGADVSGFAVSVEGLVSF